MKFHFPLNIVVSLLWVLFLNINDVSYTNNVVASEFFEPYPVFLSLTTTPQTAASRGNDQCLNSFQNLANKLSDAGETGGDAHSRNPLLPLQPWEEIHPAVYPGIDESDTVIWYGNPVIRTFDSHQEVWFTGIIRRQSENSSFLEPFISVFRPDIGDWRMYSGYFADTPFGIQQLHVSYDGTVWGIPSRFGSVDINEPFELPLLARFNDVSQQFEAARGIDTLYITADTQNAMDEAAVFYNPVRTIAIDHHNIVWLFATPGGIYRYDPQQETTEHILNLVRITHVAVSPSGDFVFQASRTQASELDLFLFSPLSNQVTEVTYPSDIGRFIGYAFDPQARLWLGSRGYRDANGAWHSIALSWEESEYGPVLDFVSSDGRLWFSYSDESYPNGRAWYDPDANGGCTFTGYSFDLGGYAEDSEGFLWLTYGTRIYRLNLSH
jgi:hypothetical protein